MFSINPSMALIRVHLHLHLPITRFNDFRTPTKLRISCSNSNSNNSSSSSISDTELAMDLELEIEKMKTQVVQTQEAMRRSRKLLYAEMCSYLGLGEEELRRKWERMGEDDKWVLAQEFVSDWGSNFHPLSAKSVKELVDQHLFLDGNDDDDDAEDDHFLFSGLKKLMGFPL